MDLPKSLADRFRQIPLISGARDALRVHARSQIARAARISNDSPISMESEGLNGGGSWIRTVRRLVERSVSHAKTSESSKEARWRGLRNTFANCGAPRRI